MLCCFWSEQAFFFSRLEHDKTSHEVCPFISSKSSPFSLLLSLNCTVGMGRGLHGGEDGER